MSGQVTSVQVSERRTHVPRRGHVLLAWSDREPPRLAAQDERRTSAGRSAPPLTHRAGSLSAHPARCRSSRPASCQPRVSTGAAPASLQRAERAHQVGDRLSPRASARRGNLGKCPSLCRHDEKGTSCLREPRAIAGPRRRLCWTPKCSRSPGWSRVPPALSGASSTSDRSEPAARKRDV
jgi:hypothetical protein